jgi:uncharacterized protein (DUF924 family)
MTTITAILDFWLDEVGAEQWFVKDEAIDRAVADRFNAVYEHAAAGLYDDWRWSPVGSLALLILLDQFPRNMFRDSCRAFATDAKARSLAKWALARDLDREMAEAARGFFLLPLQHSEHLADQMLCVSLTAERLPGSDSNEYAVQHRDIVQRFGRFPHRNAVLGRETTAEEAAFLTEPGSAF